MFKVPNERATRLLACEHCGLEMRVYKEQPYPVQGGWWCGCSPKGSMRPKDPRWRFDQRPGVTPAFWIGMRNTVLLMLGFVVLGYGFKLLWEVLIP